MNSVFIAPNMYLKSTLVPPLNQPATHNQEPQMVTNTSSVMMTSLLSNCEILLYKIIHAELEHTHILLDVS